MIARIRQLIDDPALSARLGQEAQATVRKQFSTAAFIDGWQAVLTDDFLKI